jgi:hypothetical protein
MGFFLKSNLDVITTGYRRRLVFDNFSRMHGRPYGRLPKIFWSQVMFLYKTAQFPFKQPQFISIPTNFNPNRNPCSIMLG